MPLPEEQLARARSFGSVADHYERARPGYPLEAVAWLVGGRSVEVVDLGAGTGKLTRVLLELGHDVVALEPLDEMRALLTAALPGVEALAGSAEEIPLPDASADVVTVAQAFHWFDLERALPEMARLLRPGGTLGVIWNLRDDREPWVAALSRVIGDETVDEDEQLAGLPFFGEAERRRFGFSQILDAEALLALVRSRSRWATLGIGEQERVLDDVRRLVLEHPGLAGRRTFELPYLTEAFRFPRL